MDPKRPEVLVTDFDGTLAWLSLPYCIYHWMSEHRNGLIPLIPFLPLVFVVYLLRPPKRSAKETILQHKIRRGGRVVVFSSTENLWVARLVIWSWLKLWRVPCDRLALRPHGALTDNFKAKILLEENCSVLLENKTSVINQFIGEMLDSGFRDISIIIQQRYSMVSFQRGGDVA
ncbi:hypothetical protein KJ616_01600 [Patescibacteria group bacterium]|nr:hypothetical protein [Patescibacteria group bacterium]